MKQEIDAALDILVCYVSRFGSVKAESIDEFRTHLQKRLLEHYQGHWYPDKPIKGQAFRSLEFNKENEHCDVIVGQICAELGFASSLLGIRHDITLWIDPYEVTIRIGSHASPKENQQLLVARFDKEGNELAKNDLDTLFSQSRLPVVTTTTLRASPTNSSSCDSASCSGASTPQRTSSPFPVGQPLLVIPPATMYHNIPLFTPPRALSPQAPAFQMSPSAPIKVPVKHEQNSPLHSHANSISSESSPSDGHHMQPDRSDTPHSMYSTTSNESSDSGYCGYVESFPYYYKLNRLYKALAIQKLSGNGTPVGKGAPNYSPGGHQRRRAPHQYHPQLHHQQAGPIIPSSSPGATAATLSSSPPTPTPMNINQFASLYAQQSSYLPMPTTVADSRKSKY